MNEDSKAITVIVLLLLFVCLFGVGGGCYAYPHYKVFSVEMDGKGKLREAESTRMIQIEDAKGKEIAAKLLAGAEIERAKGVAEANKIIGDSLRNNPEYLTWLWVEKVADNPHGNTVIYIPTESGMPILEAGRGVGKRTEPVPEPKKK